MDRDGGDRFTEETDVNSFCYGWCTRCVIDYDWSIVLCY